MVVLFIFLSLKAKRFLVHELEIWFLLEANENNPLACFETDRLYLHASMVTGQSKVHKEALQRDTHGMYTSGPLGSLARGKSAHK